MLGTFHKRRNSDVMSSDDDGAEVANGSSDARSSVLVTPFKVDSDTDFDNHRREDSQYDASKSPEVGGQHDSTNWYVVSDLCML